MIHDYYSFLASPSSSNRVIFTSPRCVLTFLMIFKILKGDIIDEAGFNAYIIQLSVCRRYSGAVELRPIRRHDICLEGDQ